MGENNYWNSVETGGSIFYSKLLCLLWCVVSVEVASNIKGLLQVRRQNPS
jgi:hypothetical protein